MVVIGSDVLGQVFDFGDSIAHGDTEAGLN